MAFYYPDTSDWDQDISYAGCIAVCSKAGENFSEDPYFQSSKTRAANAGAYLFGYWFLHEGNAAGQAQAAHSVVGSIPLMLDVETTTNSNPSLGDMENFLAEFSALGGHCHLLYLPHWYWNDIGSPSLAPLQKYGLYLVTSDYQSPSANGPGWNGYGGLSVYVWQYSSTNSLNGQYPIDFNLCEASLMDLESVATTGAASGTEPTLSDGSSGAAVIVLQKRLNVWGAKLAVDGSFGPSVLAAVKAFQTREKLSSDGVVGPATWAKLNLTPSGPQPYPSPAGFEPFSINLYVVWDKVLVAGKPVPSYTVQALDRNGAVAAHEVATNTNTTLIGLVPGETYTVRVWSNGGAIAPSASEFTITV